MGQRAMLLKTQMFCCKLLSSESAVSSLQESELSDSFKIFDEQTPLSVKMGHGALFPGAAQGDGAWRSGNFVWRTAVHRQFGNLVDRLC